MQITDDGVVEQHESFLEDPPDLDSTRVVIAQGVTDVVIDDDDGKFKHR